MSVLPNPKLRHFPVLRPDAFAPGPQATEATEAPTLTDLTHHPRMGLRGQGTRVWCQINEMPFPDAINDVVRHDGFRIARLGESELLIMSENGTAFPEGFKERPAGAFSGYRDETWAWFHLAGPGTAAALASGTSAGLAAGDKPHVVQTRFAGLDAVLLVAGSPARPAIDIFIDICAHGYMVDTLAERCPGIILDPGSR